MDTLAPLGHALHNVFTVVPDACAREVGFTQRRSKLTAAAFTQAFVRHEPSDCRSAARTSPRSSPA